MSRKIVIVNEYMQVTDTDIFNICMLTDGYNSICTSEYSYPLHSNLN